MNHLHQNFLAAQTAGSMRISGFRVSAERERMLESIIAGELAQDELRREVIEKHLKKAASSSS